MAWCQAITRTNVNKDIWNYLVSPWANELTSVSSLLLYTWGDMNMPWVTSFLLVWSGDLQMGLTTGLILGLAQPMRDAVTL